MKDHTQTASLFQRLLPGLLLVALSILTPPAVAESDASAPTLEVFRSPDCSCCHRWIEHLRDNGFEVRDNKRSDLAVIKQQLGVPKQLASCHTAKVGNYVIEGHVPANDIRRLLDQRPAVSGLSVPNMPIGSPGMEMGTRRDAYDVLTFDSAGNLDHFNHYPAR
ncbi:hypothetical protein J2T55_001073 [Methylohalomonas lacus]|uniref:DUF411 domain-containing protein n=1 Tax=Methylohalomonas lacus TaxID=398773 RepID=A0AAE3L1E1_9GAMM|nr:DUF411 domain-containing protein [Methylohalomonas lacus]MCS3903056.1 hypothetical protein [Methylohalomonas lacus]